MKYLFFVFLLITINCTPKKVQKKEMVAYFDIPSFIKKTIKNQGKTTLSVKKTTNVNGISKEIIKNKPSTSFWETELFSLLSEDINKPLLQNNYLIKKNVTEANSNLQKIIYTILPNTNTQIKKIEIKYLNQKDEIRQLLVVLETKNPVYTTKKRMQVWVNNYKGQLKIDSLKTSGFNKIIMLDSIKYTSTLIIQ